jgi:hypothetical protein
MKKSYVACFVAILISLWLSTPSRLNARQPVGLRLSRWDVPDLSQCGLSSIDLFVTPEESSIRLEDSDTKGASIKEQGGIKEEISERYRARYDEWKNEFLSTETGRRQWESYTRNTRITLTITVANENQHGATTGKYKWNDAGELTGITITLGSEINQGYPDPVYYPVMNSLATSDAEHTTNGDILAATKIAHEFGHVNQAAGMDGKLYQLQNQLMPLYKTIFLSNGHDTHDPRLIKMAKQMGGTSVEVWEDREYWGEANAMLFLRDRVSEKSLRCILFARIKRTVEEYAESYAERFNQIAQLKPSLCGWQ